MIRASIVNKQTGAEILGGHFRGWVELEKAATEERKNQEIKIILKD